MYKKISNNNRIINWFIATSLNFKCIEIGGKCGLIPQVFNGAASTTVSKCLEVGGHGIGQYEVLYQCLPGQTRKITRGFIRITGGQTKIWKKCLLSETLEHYHCSVENMEVFI